MANTWTDYGIERMLKVSLHTAEAMPTAAKIILLSAIPGTPADVTLATGVTEVAAGNGYAPQSSRRAHFGLGEHEKVDKVEIRWPSGTAQTLESPDINKIIKVEEPVSK